MLGPSNPQEDADVHPHLQPKDAPQLRGAEHPQERGDLDWEAEEQLGEQHWPAVGIN